MEKISNSIKDLFKGGDIVKILIVINIIVFLVLNIVNIIQGLFGLSGINIEEYIALSSRWSGLKRFWTPLTYMFAQKEVLHIFFNLIILFFYGRLFLTFFNTQQLLSLYILGGLCGGLFFLISYSIFPFFAAKYPSFLIGSSASLMAIIFGISVYRPQMEIKLFGLFDIKLIYLAWALFILDFLNLLSSNGGGHISHIGGAFTGYLFAVFYHKGKDITSSMQTIFQNINKSREYIFSGEKAKKPYKTKSCQQKKYRKDSNAYRSKFEEKMNEEEIDKILDKIKSSGYASLTREEKKKLFDASDKK